MFKLMPISNYLDPLKRRELLLLSMNNLEKNNIGCVTCPGTCCTKFANSMLISPLEAYDILTSFDLSTDTELLRIKKLLKENIETFRLNKEINTGKKNQSYFRRTYTCPFFNGNELGCTIKKSHKPYGCLGFNPKVINDNGSSCVSDQAMLFDRENNFLEEEQKLNANFKNILALSWDKKTIPEALLEFIEKMESKIE